MNPVAESLFTLMEYIVANDERALRALVEAEPLLASAQLRKGAQRNCAETFFFDEIRHYVYSGDTALHVAAFCYDQKVAEFLVAHGASARAANRRGAEPLHYAVDGGPGLARWNPLAQASFISFLISVGADVEAKDKNGTAPLHRAVRNRCSGAVAALLSAGAGARTRNDKGSTPLHLAVQNTGRGGTGSDAARENQKEIIELLLANGADFDDMDASGRTVRESVSAACLKYLYL